LRELYFKENNKNQLSTTIFQSFIVNCMGKTIMPDRAFRLNMEEKIKKKKGPYRFRYSPNQTRKDPTTANYVFMNTSGNEVNYKKNLRIMSVDTTTTSSAYSQ
jgi:hypothetical protein